MQFHLGIFAADIVETAVFVQDYQVSAMVQPGDIYSIVLLFVRIVKEHPGRKVRSVPIAVAHLHAADKQFSLLARSNQFSLFIGHVAYHSGDRLADILPLICARNLQGGNPHTRFGGPVANYVTVRIISFYNPACKALRNRFSSDSQGIHGREIEIREYSQQRRRKQGESNPLLNHKLMEKHHILLMLLLSYDQGAAIEKRRKNLQDRDVKTDTGKLENNRVFAHMVIVRPGYRLQKAIKCLERHRNALGLPCGAGRVDDIGFGDRAAQLRQRLHQRAGEQFLEIVLGNEYIQGGILADEVPAVCRRLHIDGNIGAAQFQGRQDTGDKILVPSQRDADTEGNIPHRLVSRHPCHAGGNMAGHLIHPGIGYLPVSYTIGNFVLVFIYYGLDPLRQFLEINVHIIYILSRIWPSSQSPACRMGATLEPPWI